MTTRSGSAGAPFEVLTFDAGDNAASNGSVANGAMTNRSPNGAASDGSACNGASPDRFASGHVAKNGSELAAAVNGAHQPAPNVAEGSSVFAVDRPAAAQPASSICLDAHLEGDRPARDALVGRVIDQLTPLGFIAERLTPSRSRLRSADGRMVAITARPITLDEDRIEIVLDTALAGPAFTALRQWHRVELGGTDQVRLSARIR